MQMPGRKYQAGNGVYRYGFNGKETDNDVKGDGNMLDFGARIYDPRLGRWLSIDYKTGALPYFSPYIFVNNNPLRYVDPDGLFLLDVHQRIAKNALTSFYKKNNGGVNLGDSYFYGGKQRWASFVYGIQGGGTIFQGGITSPDWHQSEVKSSHFDQMNFKQIAVNFATISASTTESITSYKNGGISEFKLGEIVGHKLHAIADFYSHSNYVELYVQAYGKSNDINSIPTLNEVLSDAKYAKFAAILKKDLHTGIYPGTGKGSHREMNHDVGAGSTYTAIVPETRGKKVTYESKAAEAVVTKASTEYLQSVKTEIEKK